MDRLWYHRLLDGSVQAGIQTETALKALGYNVDLGSQISAKSPFRLWFFGMPIHSKIKMDIFYLMLVVTLLIVGGCLGFGIRPQPLSGQPATASVAAGGNPEQPSQPEPSTVSINAASDANNKVLTSSGTQSK